MAGTWSTGGNLSTARNGLAGCGTQTSGLSFGGNTGSVSGVTEEYNGTTWNSGGDLSTFRKNLGGAGTQSAGLSFGGQAPGNSNITEEYNGTAWSSGGNLAISRYGLGGIGTQTAGLSFGGYTSTHVATTEEYNGTTWNSGGDLSISRRYLSGCGTQTAGLSFGGLEASNSNVTEEYSGTAWSSGGNLAVQKYGLAGCGTQTAGLSFGGFTTVYVAGTEEYNGTAWSTGGDLAISRSIFYGAGSQSAGLSFGGYTGSFSNATEEYDAAATTTTSSTTSSSTTSSTASTTSSTAPGETTTSSTTTSSTTTSSTTTSSTTTSSTTTSSTASTTTTSSSSSTTTTTVYRVWVDQDFDETYDLLSSGFPYNYVVEYYRDKAVAQSESNEWYGDKALPYNSFDENYENQIKIENSHDITYTLMAKPQSATDSPYTICDTKVYGDSEILYNLNDKDPAISSNTEFYSLMSGITEVQDYSVTVKVDGITVQAHDIEINGGVDNYCLSLRMEVAEATDYILCSYGKTVTLTIGSEVFNFFLEGQAKTKQNGSTIYIITGVSLVSQLDKPVATPLLKVWDTETTAKAVVEDLASDYIDAVTHTDWWEGVDWTIPANILYANNESPMVIIRKIVKASGGIMQSYPDGTLRIRKRYPNTVPTWDTTSADVTLSDEADFFSVSENFNLKNGFDKVLVSNQSVSSSDQIRIDAVTVDSQTKQLNCYQQPYGGDFSLKTSGGNWVTIEEIGETEETLIELVEIVAGAGSVSKPIYEEITADREYKQTQLGAVTFSENGNLTTEVVGQSLLSITYITKFKQFIVKSPDIESVQFYTEAN
jgi:hypothetical protein